MMPPATHALIRKVLLALVATVTMLGAMPTMAAGAETVAAAANNSADESTLTITNSTFTNNSAVEDGGAVDVRGPTETPGRPSPATHRPTKAERSR